MTSADVFDAPRSKLVSLEPPPSAPAGRSLAPAGRPEGAALRPQGACAPQGAALRPQGALSRVELTLKMKVAVDHILRSGPSGALLNLQ